MTTRSCAAHSKSATPRAAASSMARVVVAFGLCGLLTLPLSAQVRRDSSAAPDSLAIRLRRAEEAIAQLRQQLDEQASASVTTRSRMQLELTGRVLVHGVRNDRRVNNADDPQFVRPDSISPPPTPLVMSARQTTLGVVLSARDVLGGQFVGDVDVDFYGGQQASTGGRTFPLLRLRTARGIVRWSNGELLVGQESPLIAGVNPVSPAAIGTPAFATAGNLWLWLPQIRGTIESSGDVRIALQGAVLANITGDPVGLFDTDVDQAERSGRPALETRVRVRWGEADHQGEIGCGAHVAWLDGVNSAPMSTHAFACDARVALTSALELRGEGYDGRGLRGLGGGGIGQNLNRSALPLDDRGGWLQVNLRAGTPFGLGAGCGIDAPREADVVPSGRLRNQACAGYATIHPGGPLFLGTEFRQLQTKYAAGTVTNNHVSLALGFEF